MHKLKTLATLVVYLWFQQAYCLNLLAHTRDFDFNPKTAPQVGIEIELIGLTAEQTSHLLLNFFKGSVTTEKVNESLERFGAMIPFIYTEYYHQSPLVPNFLVKADDNSTSNDNFDPNQMVVEIVTQPLSSKDVLLFDHATKNLKIHGAKGTNGVNPVSIQYNVELGQGKRKNIHVEVVLNILRQYYMPQYRGQIHDFWGAPTVRKSFVGGFTKSMMERILSSHYKPNWREFFDDFMYRQSLELLGHPHAWSLDIKDVRAKVQKQLHREGFKKLLPILKYNHVRISSLLMFMFPDDWMTSFLEQTTWFKALPIVEFREPNNDFRVWEHYRSIVGFVQKVQLNGCNSALTRR